MMKEFDLKRLSENYQPLSEDSEGKLAGGFALADTAEPNRYYYINNCNCGSNNCDCLHKGSSQAFNNCACPAPPPTSIQPDPVSDSDINLGLITELL